MSFSLLFRLIELEETPSSNLTIDEFHKIDLEEEADPPAFTASRLAAKQKMVIFLAQWDNGCICLPSQFPVVV